MSDLLADLLNASSFKSGHGVRCRIASIVEGMDEKTGQALLQQVDNPAIEATALARVLDKHGHKVNAHTIRRHRRRGKGDGCTCP